MTNYEINNILINYLMKKAKKPTKKVGKKATKSKKVLAIKGLI